MATALMANLFFWLTLVPIATCQNTECPTLCADGSEPPENDNTIAVDNGDGTGVTCGQLKNLVSSPDFETSSCLLLQATAFTKCGCPTLPPTKCEICPGGGLPNPSLEDVDEDVVCADFIIGAALQGDSNLCPKIEEALVQFCGCPSAATSESSEPSAMPQETDGPYFFPTPLLETDYPSVAPSQKERNEPFQAPEVCPSLCADGTEIDPDVVESLSGLRDCEGLLLLVKSVDPDQCLTLQVVGWAECGCPTLPADLECPLCSDGSEPLAPDLVYGSGADGNNLTCGGAQERVASNPTLCRSIRNAAEETCCFATNEPTLTPKTASPTSMPTYAQTPDATDSPSDEPELVTNTPSSTPIPSLACSICSDGSDPSTELNYDQVLYLTSNGTDVTCNFLMDFMANFTNDDVKSGRCTGWQTVSSYYCGCPQPLDLSCSLCYDGSQPSKLDALVGPASNAISCRNLVVNAARLDRNDSPSCTQAQLFGISECGCPLPNQFEDFLHEVNLLLCSVPRREMTREERRVLRMSVLDVVNEWLEPSGDFLYDRAMILGSQLDTQTCVNDEDDDGDGDGEEMVSLEVRLLLIVPQEGSETTEEVNRVESFFLNEPEKASSRLVAKLVLTGTSYFQNVTWVRLHSPTLPESTPQPTTDTPSLSPTFQPSTSGSRSLSLTLQPTTESPSSLIRTTLQPTRAPPAPSPKEGTSERGNAPNNLSSVLLGVVLGAVGVVVVMIISVARSKFCGCKSQEGNEQVVVDDLHAEYASCSLPSIQRKYQERLQQHEQLQ